jgi:hypothetical protein
MLAAMNRTIALSLVLIVGCVAGATTAQLVVPKARAGTNPTRWEYHCVDDVRAKESATPRLNALGAEGWELVTTSPQGNLSWVFACFKRALP